MIRALPVLLLFPIAVAAGRNDRSCYAGAQQLARGDYASALRSLQGVVADGTSTAAELNLRGVAELATNDAQRALATFDLAIAKDGRLREAQLNRGLALLRLGRNGDAAKSFEALAKSDDAIGIRARFHRAMAAEAAGDRKAALEWIAKASATSDPLPEAILYQGVLLEKSGAFAEAGEAFKKYLAFRPESVTAMVRFGVVAMRAGFFETARTTLQRVVRQAPGTREAIEASKYLVMLE